MPVSRETIVVPHTAFEETEPLDLFALASSPEGRPSLCADDVLSLMASLKASSQVPLFFIAPETYKTIQRINSQRPHQRKLRKCHMRRIVARARREKGRYL